MSDILSRNPDVSPYLLQPLRTEERVRWQILWQIEDDYRAEKIDDAEAVAILMTRLGYTQKQAARLTLEWDEPRPEPSDYGEPRAGVGGQPLYPVL